MTCYDRSDLGLLLLRLGTGGVLAAHGTQKLFGWFGGGGLEGTGTAMEAMGYTPGKASAVAAGLAEAAWRHPAGAGPRDPRGGCGGGRGMVGAAAVHLPNGFFAMNGGYEHAAQLALTAAGLAVAGPGRLSLDHALRHAVNRGWMVPVALGVTAAATLAVVGARNKRVRRAVEGEQETLFDE